MKRIIAIVIALAFASMVYAASVTPTVKAVNRSTKSTDYRTTSWTFAKLIVTNARNDTVTFARGDANPWFDQNSLASLHANYLTNNTAADSGDVIIKLLVGWDSAAYYVPIADTLLYRTDMTADSVTTAWNGYSYNRLLNDSTLTYPLFTVQPKANATGYSLALPLQWPTYRGITYPFTRVMLIFTKGAKFKANDTTWIQKGAIILQDYIK